MPSLSSSTVDVPTAAGGERVSFRPGLANIPEAWKVLRQFGVQLASLPAAAPAVEFQARIDSALTKCLRGRDSWDRAWRQELIASVCILADLARIGWRVKAGRAQLWVVRSPDSRPEEQRERRREQLHSQRDQQLRDPAARAFIAEMERPRVLGAGAASVLSLMRDGRELAAKLRHCQGLPESVRAAHLDTIITPYLQLVDDTTRCAHTGLRLIDIWRYFRHTWANPYQSVPGRSMALLVRDAAVPRHPVMGIAAISSSAVQMTTRDRFIGWEADAFVDWAAEHPSARIARWAMGVITGTINELYKTDFLANQLFSLRDLAAPDDHLIELLEADAAVHRDRHHELMQSREYKRQSPSPDAEEQHWEEQARTPLFRAKRAEELASLLSLRRVLMQTFGQSPTAVGLKRLLATPTGRAALGSIARKAKARRVGICIADLAVCGAVPPYSALLGGKLVAMLAASPAVVAEYRRRYSKAASVIASSMAGRRIERPAELAFIGTTSLYGVRPSQYDRINVPCERMGGRAGESIRYECLEHTQGFGTFQFSEATVTAIMQYLRQSSNGLTVNSVFGEGANPRLRKIREGLAGLGLSSEFLIHGLDKLVYAVPLIRNLREYLLGLDTKPDYLFSRRKVQESTAAVGRWWCERWLVPRVAREDVLQRVGHHTLSLPIRHGARVRLPEVGGDNRPLFEWS